jgi:RNase H-fold protein (predicted Holliday junction resolvase)
MRLLSLKPFFEALSTEKVRLKVGAIDFGTKRVGIAISDETRTFAFPLTNVDRKQPRMTEGSLIAFLKDLESICTKHRIGALVIGFPTHAKHSSTNKSQLTPLCTEILTVLSHAPTLLPMVRYMYLNRLFLHSRISFFEKFSLPCTLWSEYNSTVIARQLNREAHKSVQTFIKQKDEIAASIILQVAFVVILVMTVDDVNVCTCIIAGCV